MNFRCKVMDFISDIDKKFAQWKKQHAKSASQQAEIEKYARINELRDHAQEISEDQK